MAIGYLSPLATAITDDLVYNRQRFYPQEIQVGHSQLRQLISCPSPRRVYLVNQSEVLCLDTKTQRRKKLADLPFKARCIAAGHGWFCAGGDDQGYFAAIRIPDDSTDPHTLDAQQGSGPLSVSPLVREARSVLDSFDRPFPPRIRVERLGKNIVNSVALHRFPGTAEDGTGEVVALLTNNDRTVRMYSLTHDREISVEKFAFEMNHATISPDGKLLIVVGDKEWAYFYQRVRSDSASGAPHQWERIRVVRLHKPPHRRNSGARRDAYTRSAYFTTAWSPSSDFCATGSEDGYVVLFNVAALLDDSCADQDTIVSVLSSSRPDCVSNAGAIRSMLFTPEPYDLLVWVEQFGRVCVSDIRKSCVVRQIVTLDSTSAGAEKRELLPSSRVMSDPGVDDYDDDLDFIRRHQQAIAAPSAVSAVEESGPSISSQFDLYVEHERLREGLTAQERQILDGLRTTRQREAALSAGRETPSQASRSHPTARRPGQASDTAVDRMGRALGGIRPLDEPARRAGSFTSSVLDAAGSPDPLRRTSHLEQVPEPDEDARTRMLRHHTPEEVDALIQTQREELVRLDRVINRINAFREARRNDPSTSSIPFLQDPSSPWNMNTQEVLESQRFTVDRYGRTGEPTASSAGTQDLHESVSPSGGGGAHHNGRWTSTNVPAVAPGPRGARASNDIITGLHAAAGRRNVEGMAERVGEMDAQLALDVIRARERERRARDHAWRTEVEQLSGAHSALSRRTELLGLRRDGWRRMNSLAPHLARATHGVGSAGCCTDEGGQVIYVGTEEGVFELRLNQESRKCWPSIELR